MVAVPPPPQRTAAALVAQGLAYDLSRDHRGAHWPQTEQRRGSPHVPTSPRPSLVAERKEPKVCVTHRWREMDSNHRFRTTTSFVSCPRRTSPVALILCVGNVTRSE